MGPSPAQHPCTCRLSSKPQAAAAGVLPEHLCQPPTHTHIRTMDIKKRGRLKTRLSRNLRFQNCRQAGGQADRQAGGQAGRHAQAQHKT